MQNDIQSPLPLFSANLTPSEHSLYWLESQLPSWSPSVVVQKQSGMLQPRSAIPPSRTSCISVPMLHQLYCLNPPHAFSLLLRGLPQETGQSSKGKINLHSTRWLNCLEVNAAYFLLQKVTKPLPDKQGSCRHFSWVLNSCRKEAVCTLVGWLKHWDLQHALHCGNQNSTICARTQESHFRWRGSFRPWCN